MPDIGDWKANRAITASWREGAAYAPAYHAIAEHIQSEPRTSLDWAAGRKSKKSIGANCDIL